MLGGKGLFGRLSLLLDILLAFKHGTGYRSAFNIPGFFVPVDLTNVLVFTREYVALGLVGSGWRVSVRCMQRFLVTGVLASGQNRVRFGRSR